MENKDVMKNLKQEAMMDEAIASVELADNSVMERFDEKFVSKSHIGMAGTYHNDAIQVINGEKEVIENIKSFILTELQRTREQEREKLKRNIGLLMRWLNEKPERLITNEQIEKWLNI